MSGGRPRSLFFPRDEYFMRLALREAERALGHDDVPVGALMVHDGEVIGAAGRKRPTQKGPFDGPLTLQPLDDPLYHRLQPAHAIQEALTPALIRRALDPHSICPSTRRERNEI